MNSTIAGVAGSLAQGALMFAKKRFDILPSFQPYAAIQQFLERLSNNFLSSNLVPLLTLINGAVVLSYLFGRLYDRLPSKSPLIKGFLFGLFGWLLFNLSLFPMIGYGVFVSKLELGVSPAVFSLAMIETYSLVLAFVYARLARKSFQAGT